MHELIMQQHKSSLTAPRHSAVPSVSSEEEHKHLLEKQDLLEPPVLSVTSPDFQADLQYFITVDFCFVLFFSDGVTVLSCSSNLIVIKTLDQNGDGVPILSCSSNLIVIKRWIKMETASLFFHAQAI